MNSDKAWDSDVHSADYGHSLSFDPKGVSIEVDAGLNTSEPEDWRKWDVCLYAGADVTRIYKLGQLAGIVTPESALSFELIQELAGVSIAADDTVSMSTELGPLGEPTGGIKLCVNNRQVATGYPKAHGKTEWRREAVPGVSPVDA